MSAGVPDSHVPVWGVKEVLQELQKTTDIQALEQLPPGVELSEVCAICTDSLLDDDRLIVLINGKHLFHAECMWQYLDESKKAEDPLDESPITKVEFVSKEAPRAALRKAAAAAAPG